MKMYKESLFWLIVIVSGVKSLTIKELKVPEIIKFGTENEIILDCDYDIGNNADGLVVKWFYEDTQQVYQWIPKNRPQDIGRLKGKINLNYKASDEPNEMYRALKITQIDPRLTGNYTCVVSTFADEVRESKRMVIYDTEDTFDLTYDNVDDDTLKVTCSASNIYPKPDIVIHAKKPDLKSEVENVTLDENNWQISTSMLVDVDAGPETIKCELKIPDANYSITKELHYSSQETTENTSSSSEVNLQLADDNALYQAAGATWDKACVFLLVISPLISSTIIPIAFSN